MKGRISSRDDLFLSALDMYTLLSLALLGFAVMVSPSRGETELIDLPSLVESGSKQQGEKVPWVQWNEWSETNKCLNDGHTRQCEIRATLPEDNISGTLYKVPCCPRAFFPKALSTDQTELPSFRSVLQETSSVLQQPEVAIACNRSERDACFNLQWILAGGGFTVRAVTVYDEESSP